MSDFFTKAIEKQQRSADFSIINYAKFIVPSLIGVFMILTPIPASGGVTIPIAYLAGVIGDVLGEVIPAMAVVLISLSVLFSVAAVFFKPALIMKNPFLYKLFHVSKFWLTVRFLGMVFVIMAYFEAGPYAVHSANTGGLLLYDLIPILFSVFLLAGFFLPLLLNFGLMEFLGAQLIKVMRPVFKLPGRASLDCIASWVGDGTIGVMLTTKQYREGFYTQREAAVAATTFSVVSITFTIAVLSYLDLAEYFLPYYLTIVIAGFAAAVIMPRIPPLSKKPDLPCEGVELIKEEAIPDSLSPLKWGLKQALERAGKNSGISATVKEGCRNVLDMWLGVLPLVMMIGTTALMIAEYTPLFAILGKPFEPLLALLQVPEAEKAAQTMVVGFADMFLPAVIGSGIESEMTRFVIAGVSVTQLIYMSELGGLLLGSNLPLKIKDLILIFLLRTVITLPIIVAAGHLLF